MAQDVADFVDRIDQLVTAFDHHREQRIERVVWIHRILAIGMALLLILPLSGCAPACCGHGNSYWVHGAGGQPARFYPARAHQRSQRNGDPRHGIE